MNKLLTVIFTLVILGSLILAGCGGSTTSTTATATTSTTAATSTTATTSPTKTYTPEEPLELKFAYHTPVTASLVGEFFQPWTDSIEQATGGRVRITHYPGGTLASLADYYDAVVSGLIDIAMIEPEESQGRFPLTEFTLLPYIFPNGPVGARVTYEILEKYTFDTEWKDVKVLMTPSLPPMDYHGTKQLHTLEDFQGMKIRSGGLVEGWVIEALGATPVEMETGDLSTSLERGMIDGCFLTHSALNAFGARDVTQYRTICKPFSRTWELVMNLQTWESLPDDIRTAFEENSGAEASAQLAIGNEYATIVTSGKIIDAYDKRVGNPGWYTPPADELARWRDAIMSVTERWLQDVEAKGLPGRAMLEEVNSLVEKYKDLYILDFE